MVAHPGGQAMVLETRAFDPIRVPNRGQNRMLEVVPTRAPLQEPQVIGQARAHRCHDPIRDLPTVPVQGPILVRGQIRQNLA